MKKNKKLHIFIICLLCISLFASALVPSSAADFIAGWNTAHRVYGLGDTYIVFDDDWYLGYNAALTAEVQISENNGVLGCYDTSLTYDEFFRMICMQEESYGTGLCPDYHFYQFNNFPIGSNLPRYNVLTKPNEVWKTAALQIAIQLGTRAPYYAFASWWSGLAFDAVMTATQASEFGAIMADLTAFGIHFSLLNFAEYLLQNDISFIDYIRTGVDMTYWRPAVTHDLNGRSFYWVWNASDPEKTASGYQNVGYFSCMYRENLHSDFTEAWRYYVKARYGNNLNSSGVSGGVTADKPYFTDPSEPTENLDGTFDYAVYDGNTQSYAYVDYSTNEIYDIYGDAFIADGDLWYNPDNRQYTYLTANQETNYYITVSNYYTYNYVNYYMPGSDVPFATYSVYYELPDGRNSAMLSADDILGMNLDFDVVPYDKNSEDTRMLALYHLDASFDNSALTLDNPFAQYDEWQLDHYNGVTWKHISDGQSVTTPTQYYAWGGNSVSLPSWTAPYSGYYRIKFSGSASGSAGGWWYSLDNSRMLGFRAWQSNGVQNGETYLNGSTLGGSSGSYSFSVYLNSGDTLVGSIWNALQGSGCQIGITTITGFGASGQNSVLGDYSDFEFSSGASTQFVTTGDDNFGGALYLDGLAHQFTVSLPNRITADSDFTLSFRYYQEQSTNTGTSGVYFGGTQFGMNSPVAFLEFNGSTFNKIGLQSAGSGISASIPSGTWNTITLCRYGNTLTFYLNGLTIYTATIGGLGRDFDGLIYFNFAADNNVHYIDEIMVSDYSMYDDNHIPRLISWDTNTVYTLPYSVSKNSVAVRTDIPISGYRIGGVRPTFPDYGAVYCYVNNNYIESIQVYNGSAWLDVGGAVYFNGHWNSLENFRFGTVEEQFDATPDAPIYQSGETVDRTNILDVVNTILDKLGSILEKIIEFAQSIVDNTGNIISEAIKGAVGLITSLAQFVSNGLSGLVSGFMSLLGHIVSGVGSFFSSTAPLGGLIQGFFGALPAPVSAFLVGGFSVVMLGAVVHFLNK